MYIKMSISNLMSTNTYNLFNNNLVVSNTINSTNSLTGSLQVLGGAGIKKDLYVGGTIYGTLDSSNYSYSVTPFSLATIGTIQGTNLTGKIIKCNDLITICFDYTTATIANASTVIGTNVSIPTAFVPTTNTVYSFIPVIDSTYKSGVVTLDTSGLITIYTGNYESFGVGGTASVLKSSFTYII